MLRFPEMWRLADCCSAGHLSASLQPCQHSAEQFHEGKRQHQSTRRWLSTKAVQHVRCGAKATGEGMVMELRGRRTLQNRAVFRTVQLARMMLWGLQASLQLSTESRVGKEELCLPVTRWKCLTLCLQSWVVRLDARKLHRFSDGMLLCSLYHLVFNFFPRVMGQWLESNIATSSCLW